MFSTTIISNVKSGRFTASIIYDCVASGAGCFAQRIIIYYQEYEYLMALGK